jgi:hypothetical protein
MPITSRACWSIPTRTCSIATGAAANHYADLHTGAGDGADFTMSNG